MAGMRRGETDRQHSPRAIRRCVKISKPPAAGQNRAVLGPRAEQKARKHNGAAFTA
jgi:hypothetical protein